MVGLKSLLVEVDQGIKNIYLVSLYLSGKEETHRSIFRFTNSDGYRHK